ncbi:hypothetical protein GQ42DRAFT_102832, partial [Ramicandelaber brevisporus]
VASLSKAAILHMANINPPLVITTLSIELMPSSHLQYRQTILQIITLLIQKRSGSLYPFLARLADAVIRTLDPRSATSRRVLLSSATSCIQELIHSYACVAFHADSQRLAVGTADGATIVFDLRTAARCQVLEGHTKPVSALAYS